MSTPNNPSPAPSLQFPFMSNQQFGQAGPGPSTMAQNRPGIPPHQLQLLQQVTAAARSQGMNLSPQQITMVVAQMQSQGNNGNPAALMNALRSLGHGQGQGQGGPGQGQGQPGGGGAMPGMPGMPGMNMGGMGMGINMGMDMQQQQQGGQSSQHTMQQQRLQQMMQGQQANMMASMSPSQQYGGQQGRSGTPSQNDSARQSMPPPGPPTNPSPHPGQMLGMPGMPNQPRFTPSPQQQALLAHQHQQMLANPQFQALSQQQQQMQLMGMHQKMMSVFMANSQSQQQQSPSMQQTTQGSGSGPDHGSNMQQQTSHHPPTPQGGPPSSIPPHMAPTRPASASSHHPPPSPHHQGSPMAAGTPPPMNNQYMPPQPGNAGSPAPSSHSQHGQQHSTSQAHPPPHSASPLSAQQTGPSPRPSSTVDVNGQMMGQPGSRPPQGPVFPPNSSGMTSQQQQQMAAAMNIFGQAAQAQGQQGGNQGSSVRPNQTPIGPGQNMTMGRPPSFPIPGVNPAEFPFDFRLIPVLRHAADPRWQSDMRSKNPHLLQAVTAAQGMINQGLVRPEMMQKMHQFYFATVGMSQGRPPPPGTTGIPPQMQHQFMAGLPGSLPSPQVGTPDRRESGGASSARPLSSHAAPEPSPGHALGMSANRERDPKTGTPVVAAMPPPAWIPGQPTPTRHPTSDTPHPQPGSSLPLPPAVPVKEWEGALRMDLPITSIIPLPEEDDDPTFGGKLPVLSDKEKESVAEWIEEDKRYAAGMKDRGKQLQKKMFKWARNNDMDTPWWSVRKGERYQPPRSRLQILFPQDKELQRSRRSHKGRRHIKFTQAQFKAMAQVEDHIIPIRLDIEHDHFRLKDTFMWNVSDTVITPEVFAASICDDFGVPAASFSAKIAAAIHERIAEYRDQVAPAEQPGPSLRGKLDIEGDQDSKALVEVFRRARASSEDRDGSNPVSDELRTDPGQENDDVKMVTFEDTSSELADERPMTVEELTESLLEENGEDLRLLIKVDIMVGNQNLSDSFEWDLNSEVQPEEFASAYCRELGLSGEFITALSHDIHEQIMVQRRCLFLTGHIFGSGLDLDDEVKTAFLPPIRNVLRTENVAMSSYTPIFATFTDEDIVAIERERERDSKRKKRATRARRGVILPDREPIKTHRTLLNGIGPNGVIAQATETSAPVPVQSSRRAAAIAAQANINLLAQDLPIPQPPTPPPNPIPARVGKPRGRPPGRGNYSRGSPASFRDDPHVNGDSTPLPSSSLKRSFMDDTGSEANSPHPKSARTQKGMSPALFDDSQAQQAKFEPGSFTQQPSALGDFKRKPDDLHDPRESKAPRMDLVAGHSGLQPHPSDGSSTLSANSMQPKWAEEKGSTPSSPSDSGSDSSDSDYGAPKKPAAAHHQASLANAGRIPSGGGKSLSPVSAKKLDAPAWVVRAHADLTRKYPNDDFAVVPRPKPADQPDAPQEWRMKCHDCPGRIYSLGPGETLSNFEVHLKNRGHMANVQARLDK